MEQRRAIIVVGIVVLLLLFIIGGTIFYLLKAFHSNSSSSGPNRVVTSNSLSNNHAGATPSAAPSNTQVYGGPGFSLNYPKTWGVLTCTNSQNFEFSPYTGGSQKIACDMAREPITVLVGKNSCQGGNVVSINGIQVRKVVTQTPTGVDYHWCTQTTPTLDITHRVSNDGYRATSQGDFSQQVEQMIGSFTKVAGS